MVGGDGRHWCTGLGIVVYMLCVRCWVRWVATDVDVVGSERGLGGRAGVVSVGTKEITKFWVHGRE